MNKTTYKKKYAEMLIDHMKSGMSFQTFGAVVDVNRSTLHRWREKHPDFKQAYENGLIYAQHYWEKLGLDGTVGKIPGFNATVWIFNMKNRFKWRDRQDITSGEEKITGEIVKVELPKNGRDG